MISTRAPALTTLILLTSFLCSPLIPGVERKTLEVNGVHFEFHLDSGYLLGLGSVKKGNFPLRSDRSMAFPFIATEYGKTPWVAPFGRLTRVETLDNGFALHLELVAKTGLEALSEVFVMEQPKAGESPRVFRDHYQFAHLVLPASFTVESRQRSLMKFLPEAQPIGTLIWRFLESDQTIAGWHWSGWKEDLILQVEQGYEVNQIRQVGSWELGGTLKNLTVVNLRYRGLGSIEQALQTDENGIAVETFTTTEILEGAAGEDYAVSPALPGDAELSDRNTGLRHRLAAWISKMARGAGIGFIDFQFRPEAIFTSFPERQGDLRAVTEVFPGDTVLSQTDEEWFPLSTQHQTIPLHRMVLQAPVDGPWTIDECRNRWMEVDWYVRDVVSKELDFVQYDVLPAVGLLWEYRYTEEIQRLIRQLPSLHADGVRQILLHNPGWINGGSIKRREDGLQEKRIRYKGGGNCNIYDWEILPAAQKPWAELRESLNNHDIALYIWLSGMSKIEGEFAKRVGFNREDWALNNPKQIGNDTYGFDMLKHNPASTRFRGEFRQTLGSARKNTGFRGFWGDSSQNLFFSQLNWGDGSGAPLQRAWWEEIAHWTRQGVSWQGESSSFPGMSCSIEVKGWENNLWYFQQISKWLRDHGQRHYQPEELDNMLFRAMAVKGWIAPDLITDHWRTKERQPNRHSPSVIPGFTRMAQEYLAALPQMKHPYVLPNGAGMLWLGPVGSEGVLFPFADTPIPEEVSAKMITGSETASLQAKALSTYRVSGADLLSSFEIRSPSETSH